jgi:hypothetical protein
MCTYSENDCKLHHAQSTIEGYTMNKDHGRLTAMLHGMVLIIATSPYLPMKYCHDPTQMKTVWHKSRSLENSLREEQWHLITLTQRRLPIANHG